MSSTNFKILSIYTIQVLLIIILKCAAEEPCETIPSEIHITKGICNIFIKYFLHDLITMLVVVYSLLLFFLIYYFVHQHHI